MILPHPQRAESRPVQPRFTPPWLHSRRVSSRSGYHREHSWTQLSGLKGVNPPVKFGERTRDCPPGQAGKEGPHLSLTCRTLCDPTDCSPARLFCPGDSPGKNTGVPGGVDLEFSLAAPGGKRSGVGTVYVQGSVCMSAHVQICWLIESVL